MVKKPYIKISVDGHNLKITQLEKGNMMHSKCEIAWQFLKRGVGSFSVCHGDLTKQIEHIGEIEWRL